MEIIGQSQLTKGHNFFRIRCTKRTGGKTLKKTRMRYDQMQDQWYVDLTGRKYGLHCGESFELYIGHEAIPCQLELGSKWYVIMGDTRLDLRENDQYKVII